ncbi:hypothetical protein [Rhodococcus pyridinivorans]|uniref:hypothetical protein n=1 Tax=Rhodococcus pyridinivorans TaxID=103816 RepID=UPI003AAC786A
MSFSTQFREDIATYASTRGDRIALFIDDPGTTGANEITGYAGYSRQTTAWAAGVVDGGVTGSECTFEVPPDATVSHVGCFNSAGVFQWAYPLANPLTFPGAMTVKITPKLKSPLG